MATNLGLGNFIKRVRDIMRQDAGVSGDAQRIEQLTWMLFLKAYDDREQEWEALDPSYQSIIPEQFRWHNWALTGVTEDGRIGDELRNFIDNELFPALQSLPVTPETPRRKSVVRDVFQEVHNYMKDGSLIFEVAKTLNEIDFTDPEQTKNFGNVYETMLLKLQSAGSAGEYYTPRPLTNFMAEHVNLKLGDRVADLACGTAGFLVSAMNVLRRQAKTNEDRDQIDNRTIYGVEKKPLPYLLACTNLILEGIVNPNIDHRNSLINDLDNSPFEQKELADVMLMNPPYGGTEKIGIQHNFPADLKSSETADLFLVLMMERLKTNGRAAVIVPDGLLFGTGNKIEIKKKLLREFNLHTIVRLPGSVFAPYTSIRTNILFFDRTHPTEQTWFYRVDMPDGYKHFSKTKPILREHLRPLDEWFQNRRVIEEDDGYKSRPFTREELEALNFNFDQCGFPQENEEVLPPVELIDRFKEDRAKHEAQMGKALENILNLIKEGRE